MSWRSPPITSERRTFWIRGGFWLLGIAAARLAVVLALGRLTGNQQFTDDAGFIESFIHHPLQILLGDPDAAGPAYWPPLFPLVVTVPGRVFLSLLPPFIADRCTFIFFELLAWPMVWALIGRFAPTPRRRDLLAGIYLVMPMAWMTTAGMSQDESVSMLVIVAITLLCCHRRYRTAALVCGLGAVAAKIYFLIPLFAVVFLPPVRFWREYLVRGALGGGLVLLVYAWTGYIQTRHGVVTNGQPGMALLHFKSHGLQSVSLWAVPLRFTDLTAAQARRFTPLLALLSAVGPVLAVGLKRGRDRENPILFIRVLAAMLLGVFLWFYHCDPEYYLMVLPLVLIGLPLGWVLVTGVFGLSLPYAVNVFYGVDNFMARSGHTEHSSAGKAHFVELYNRFVPMSPDSLYVLAWVGVVAVNLAITVKLLTLALSPPPPPPEVSPEDPPSRSGSAFPSGMEAA